MTGLVDISSELLLQRHQNGVKLARPDHINHRQNVGNSLASILKVPMNIYAYDLNHVFQFSNEQASKFCGFLSPEDVKGRHVNKFATPETANQLIQNNDLVVRSNSLNIIDEYFSRLDGFEAGATTLKFPWYNEQNDIVGIFGCSIPWNCESEPGFSQSLSMLINLGLLNSSSTKQNSTRPGVMIENTCFSKRESDVLYHLVRGKSARGISDVLGISYRTVETHISNAKSKIGAHTKSELIERIYHFF